MHQPLWPSPHFHGEQRWEIPGTVLVCEAEGGGWRMLRIIPDKACTCLSVRFHFLGDSGLWASRWVRPALLIYWGHFHSSRPGNDYCRYPGDWLGGDCPSSNVRSASSWCLLQALFACIQLNMFESVCWQDFARGYFGGLLPLFPCYFEAMLSCLCLNFGLVHQDVT